MVVYSIVVGNIIALGLNARWGYSGLFNIGIAGSIAICAYTSALLTTPVLEDDYAAYVELLRVPDDIDWVMEVRRVIITEAVARKRHSSQSASILR